MEEASLEMDDPASYIDSLLFCAAANKPYSSGYSNRSHGRLFRWRPI